MNKTTFQLAIFIHLNVMQENRIARGSLTNFVTVLIMLTDTVGTFGSDQDNKVAFVVSRSVRNMLERVEDQYVLDDVLCNQITYLKNRLEKVLGTIPDKKWKAYSRKHSASMGLLSVCEKEAA